MREWSGNTPRLERVASAVVAVPCGTEQPTIAAERLLMLTDCNGEPGEASEPVPDRVHFRAASVGAARVGAACGGRIYAAPTTCGPDSPPPTFTPASHITLHPTSPPDPLGVRAGFAPGRIPPRPVHSRIGAPVRVTSA